MKKEPVVSLESLGDPILGRIIAILIKAREEEEAEDLERRIEAARQIV